jgi:hypothetical protein
MDKRYPPLIVLGIGVCSFIKVFCYHHGDQFSLTMGMQMKIAAMGMVYKKVSLFGILNNVNAIAKVLLDPK